MNRKRDVRQLGTVLFTAGLAFLVSHAQAQIKARIVATQDQVAAACGTTNVKLVFGCQSGLYFVDFSETSPQISSISLADPAYVPDISSDGNWVAYQTGSNAEGGPSTAVATAWIRALAASGTPVKVADTGYVPRFVQNAPPDTPEVIYATSVACPQDTCYALGQTLLKKIAGGAAGPAEVVFDKGSYYGGLSWDNRYLNSAWEGGPNAFMLDLQGGNGVPAALHTMRVKKNVTNADTFVTVKTCNPSRSASRIFTNTMMFYDFSSAAITLAKCYHPILKTWGTHQLLFISRSDSEDLRVYDTPYMSLVPLSIAQGNGEPVAKEWNTPEWSNHPYFAVSGMVVDRLFSAGAGSYDHTLNSEAVYLVNLKDSLYVRLVETTDTSHASMVSLENPFVWVQVPAGFQEDSTWLKQTIWERAAGVINPYNPSADYLRRSAGSPVEIVIYSVSGRKIASISGVQNASVVIREKLRALNPGTYLVASRDGEGLLHTSRWVNVR
ncbi:MAG TPA: T9SS type A sorting domain-containing protein [Chitinivibrionales bacterium]|nr:T9SS type A sorting domain-containing protein [Chitinivibrionales bacterium]